MSARSNRFTLETIAQNIESRVHGLNEQGNPAYHLKMQLEEIKAQIPAAANLDYLIEQALKRIEKQKNRELQWAAYREELFRFRKLLEAEKSEKELISKQESAATVIL